MAIYSWGTKKTIGGFIGFVTRTTTRSTPDRYGSYIEVEVLAKLRLATRARARGYAKRKARYFKGGIV